MLRTSIVVLALVIPAITHAEMHWVKNDKIKPDNVDTVKIVYNGDVTPTLVAELISALDEINVNYPAAKSIKLFISSFGGSMESGYLAYQAVKGSKIPVETINAGMTASSATLVYCGAPKRYTFPDASFMLHPSASPNLKAEWIRPNDVEFIRKDVEDGNKYFKSIYGSCTTLARQDVEKILFSNDYARYLRPKDAEKIKLSQGVVEGIASTSVSYYITEVKN
ncbi:ATP-dependent Clp protease proteolytic subunit [Serratia marcescens]|uniref:ATP-dependent Clp protease protease subunit n=1 Tax=Serratia marcescens TaxID=615 RepID=A0AA46KA62_SERMA|nr:ATP-dependent Clp protease proteolytic subunit [Serratia marcescens]TQI86450.1 ATP-dependent Clp protease protease subunit [Serratia marcescens]HEJ7122187.1 ATP-dependent Clp protease proteolytic subunit [Serratia marcescens]